MVTGKVGYCFCSVKAILLFRGSTTISHKPTLRCRCRFCLRNLPLLPNDSYDCHPAQYQPMSSGDQSLSKPSTTGHKRHRSPTRIQLKASSYEQGHGQAGGVTGVAPIQRRPATISDGQSRSLSPPGSRPRPSRSSLDVLPTQQRGLGMKSTDVSPPRSSPHDTRPEPSLVSAADEQHNLIAIKSRSDVHQSPSRNARSNTLAQVLPTDQGPRNRRPKSSVLQLRPSQDMRDNSSPKATARQHAHGSGSREQSHHSHEVSDQAEEWAQTAQMLKVTEELRKLNSMLRTSPISSAGAGDTVPTSRPPRCKVKVEEKIMNDLQNEILYTNVLIWSDPKSTRSEPSYDDEIKEVLRPISDPEERYKTLRQILQALQRAPVGAGPGDEARKERISKLVLILPQVWDQLKETILQKDRESREQEEGTSSANSSIVSRTRAGENDTSTRPGSKRTVHLVKPL